MDLVRPTAERPTPFAFGKCGFYPVSIGLLEPADSTGFQIDIQTPFHANTGHEYGMTLGEADKLASLEYLKSL